MEVQGEVNIETSSIFFSKRKNEREQSQIDSILIRSFFTYFCLKINQKEKKNEFRRRQNLELRQKKCLSKLSEDISPDKQGISHIWYPPLSTPIIQEIFRYPCHSPCAATQDATKSLTYHYSSYRMTGIELQPILKISVLTLRGAPCTLSASRSLCP